MDLNPLAKDKFPIRVINLKGSLGNEICKILRLARLLETVRKRSLNKRRGHLVAGKRQPAEGLTRCPGSGGAEMILNPEPHFQFQSISTLACPL